MIHLTLYDLVEQGYFYSLIDISRRTGISRAAVSKWCSGRGGKANEKYTKKIAKSARKPLNHKVIATFIKGERWHITSPVKREELIRTELAPRIKGAKLSDWLIEMAKVG